MQLHVGICLYWYVCMWTTSETLTPDLMYHTLCRSVWQKGHLLTLEVLINEGSHATSILARTLHYEVSPNGECNGSSLHDVTCNCFDSGSPIVTMFSSYWIVSLRPSNTLQPNKTEPKLSVATVAYMEETLFWNINLTAPKVQMVRLLMPHLIEPKGQVRKVHEGGINDWLVAKYQGTLRIRSSNVDTCRKYFTASTVNSDQITPIDCFRVWKLMETHSHISLKPSASNWLICRHSFCKANCHLVVDSTVSNVAATRNWGVIISG